MDIEKIKNKIEFAEYPEIPEVNQRVIGTYRITKNKCIIMTGPDKETVVNKVIKTLSHPFNHE